MRNLWSTEGICAIMYKTMFLIFCGIFQRMKLEDLFHEWCNSYPWLKNLNVIFLYVWKIKNKKKLSFYKKIKISIEIICFFLKELKNKFKFHRKYIFLYKKSK